MTVRVVRGEKGFEQTVEVSQGEYWEVNDGDLLIRDGEGDEVAFFRQWQWNYVVLVLDEEPDEEPLSEEVDLIMTAWTILANAGWDAGTGDTDIEKPPGWHEAALRWRDSFHEWLRAADMVEVEADTQLYAALTDVIREETADGAAA